MKIRFVLFAGFLATTVHATNCVITVSFDGMGSGYMQSLMEADKLPYLKQLTAQGAGTLNARADYDITVTLPNHASMITSRPILGEAGHLWKSNTDPAKGTTLHSNKGAYVASVFDVAHDNGLRTGLWATKTKFSLFQVSYDAEHGAPDSTGPDNGRNKLDQFVYRKSSTELTDLFIASMTNTPCHYAFVHFGEADGVGHKHGWGSDAYSQALIKLDANLGRIMTLIKTDPRLKDTAFLIVTADHGGEATGHGDAGNPKNFTIPFYVWGRQVTPGDLYTLNQDTRAQPKDGRPNYQSNPQPIRNSDAGNLALSLLGLSPIPGSSINAKQDLKK